MKRSYSGLVVWSLMVVAAAGVTSAQSDSTSCVVCHGDADLFEPEHLEILSDFQSDVHASTGLSCHDCHGGNPDPALAEDMDAAMDPEFGPSPYVGTPEPKETPAFCGSCHSNPSYMKRFRPDARVDQEGEYWTSQHGRALVSGDERVATCVDCHGNHGILRPSDPGSMVYPTRVADTCRACHGNVEHMQGSTLEDGRPLPIDQYARWRQSVHAKAMFDKEDLSAPTCNDCHGNHGAAPPGLDSINFVCGQCHGREAELFRNSPKRPGFEAHNENLAEAGAEGCAACHESPEPQATFNLIRTFGECTSCHGNHGIVRPTMAMLSPPPPSPCAICHQLPDGVDTGLMEPERIQARHEAVREQLMSEADELGLAGEDLYNWLVDQAMILPNHTATLEDETGEPVLRPEFARLWAKFRIGKTTYSYEDPATGEIAEGRVIRCDHCHAEEPLLSDEPVGLTASRQLMRLMQELTATTAGAERVLLQARRGGVETREALLHIDQAVDAQIELEVLIHDFTLGEDSDFVHKQAEGMDQALAGLEAGKEALGELAYRRKGLAVSLVIIVMVLIGLGFKIRQISAS